MVIIKRGAKFADIFLDLNKKRQPNKWKMKEGV